MLPASRGAVVGDIGDIVPAGRGGSLTGSATGRFAGSASVEGLTSSPTAFTN